MAGIKMTTEEYLEKLNAVQNNEFELCGVEYSGAKQTMSLRHIPCGTIISHRADTFFRSRCDFCRRTDPETKQKIQEKREATNLERFGAKSVMCSEEGKKRFQESIERSGGKEAFVERIKRSNGIKYGTEWACQAPEFRAAKEIMTEEELLTLINSFSEPPSISDLLPKTPFSSHSGLGNFVQKYGHWEKLNHSFSVSGGEKSLFNWIQQQLPDIELIQSDRKILKGKEIDIYIPSMNIGIEYCGIYWHSSSPFSANGSPKPMNYHRDKMLKAREAGIRLIQIFETEWLRSPEITQAKLLSIFGLNKAIKIFARKCVVKDLDNLTFKTFLEANHIQGYIAASFKYGLYYQEELIAIMSFRKNAAGYELSRYCTKLGTHVIGGAGKLLKHFRRLNKGFTITTFADLRWTDISSNMYLSLGFNFDGVTSPNYFYYIPSQGKLNHRLNFRKQRLKILYPEVYSDDKTETQIMDELKINRIYDCGNLKFILPPD